MLWVGLSEESMLMELKVAMVLLPLDAPRIRSCADLMHEFLS